MAEATAAAGSCIYREDAEEKGLQVQSLRGYVVAIPTMNAIHGQDTWRAHHVSDEYADHSAWDVHTIIEILRKFFNASEGTSLPELAEYNWRLDKVTNPAAAPAASALLLLLLLLLLLFLLVLLSSSSSSAASSTLLLL